MIKPLFADVASVDIESKRRRTGRDSDICVLESTRASIWTGFFLHHMCPNINTYNFLLNKIDLFSLVVKKLTVLSVEIIKGK